MRWNRGGLLGTVCGISDNWQSENLDGVYALDMPEDTVKMKFFHSHKGDEK